MSLCVTCELSLVCLAYIQRTRLGDGLRICRPCGNILFDYYGDILGTKKMKNVYTQILGRLKAPITCSLVTFCRWDSPHNDPCDSRRQEHCFVAVRSKDLP